MIPTSIVPKTPCALGDSRTEPGVDPNRLSGFHRQHSGCPIFKASCPRFFSNLSRFLYSRSGPTVPRLPNTSDTKTRRDGLPSRLAVLSGSSGENTVPQRAQASSTLIDSYTHRLIRSHTLIVPPLIDSYSHSYLSPSILRPLMCLILHPDLDIAAAVQRRNDLWGATKLRWGPSKSIPWRLKR